MPLATKTINGNHSGPIGSPKVVIMHSTRSGIASKTDAEELTSTLNWMTNPNGTSSHFVLSETERVRVVDDGRVAWHAGHKTPSLDLNHAWGVEMTQPTIDRPFTEGHYANAALIGWHYVSLGVAPVRLRYWDGDPDLSGFVGHEDTNQGRDGGKSDPGPQFDWQRFIASLEDEMTEDEVKALIESMTPGQLRKHLPIELPKLLRKDGKPTAFGNVVYRDIGARQADADHAAEPHGNGLAVEHDHPVDAEFTGQVSGRTGKA